MGGVIIAQQFELDSLRSLVFVQNNAIKDLADDSSKNSESISSLAQGLKDAADSIDNLASASKSNTQSIMLLARAR